MRRGLDRHAGRGFVRNGDRSQAGACGTHRFRRWSCVVGRAHRDLHGLDGRGFERVEIRDTCRSQDHLPLLQRKVGRVQPGHIIRNGQRDCTAITVATDGVVEQRLIEGKTLFGQSRLLDRADRHHGRGLGGDHD